MQQANSALRTKLSDNKNTQETHSRLTHPTRTIHLRCRMQQRLEVIPEHLQQATLLLPHHREENASIRAAQTTAL